jgi:hypothetical protein
MNLRPGDVIALQHFLMDVARRYVVASGGSLDDAANLLASAAALDYALLLASQHGDQPFDDADPNAAPLRETLTRAATAALNFAEEMLGAPQALLNDFVERYVDGGGVFGLLRSLRAGNVLASGDIGFRAITLASDLRERRTR